MTPRIAFLLAAFVVTGAAQEGEPLHPIDARASACITANPSTHGELQCVGAALTEWDAELNRQYKKLQSTLGPEAKARLTKAQLAWIAYRDAEFALIERLYDIREGTMYGPMQNHARVKVVRARARELALYVSRREGE